MAAADGTYTARDGYEFLRDKAARGDWYPIVWTKQRIPKCSFVTWMAMHQKLMTKDRVLNIGVHCDPDCVLCDDHEDPHFFFECAFSAYVFKHALHDLLQVQIQDSTWGAWLQEVLKKNQHALELQPSHQFCCDLL